MANVTWWAFTAGVAGIILVFWTLLATRRGVQVTKEASRQELKAYLTVDCAVVVGYVGEGEDRPTYIVVFEIKNIGQTPAYNITAVGIPFGGNEASKRADAANKSPRKLLKGYLPHGNRTSGSVNSESIKASVHDDDFGVVTFTSESGDHIIFDGVIEFDDVYTIANKSLPKRTIILNRYVMAKDFHMVRRAEMIENHENESAT